MITVQHSVSRDEAIASFESSGLHLVEGQFSAADLSGDPHSHPYDVDIFVIEGSIVLDEPKTGLRHDVHPGTRITVPAGTVHAESCPGLFKAVFGASVDPSQLSAAGE